MSKNDDKIIELKKNIEKQKRELGTVKRFQPLTTCVIELDGVKYNLNVVNDIRELNFISIKLHILKMASDDLGLDIADLYVSGFSYLDWMNDINQRKDIIEYNQKYKSLNKMEKNLEKLLSDDKKTELELLEMEKMLKGE